MRRVDVIDVGLGNVASVCNSLRKAGVKATVVRSPSEISAEHLILPGVGAFDAYVEKLELSGFFEFLSNTPDNLKVLGICVGMQVLAEKSEEGTRKGLGLVPGEVRKIRTSLPLPHLGWNSIEIHADHPVCESVNPDIGFYYVHGYHFVCESNSLIASSDYGGRVGSIVCKGNVCGVQFHPEKSHDNGIKLFSNFASW